MKYQYIETENKEKLYSIYHEPNIDFTKNIGVVICNPIGQEYIRCHKSIAYLSEKLAKEGYHVLKFDYYGTGDSYGEFTEFTIRGAIENIGKAVNEIKEVYGIERVILIGIRLGATLALLYSKKYFVEGLVLWNPVVDGRKYIEEDLRKEYLTWVKGSFTKEKKDSKFYSFGYEYNEKLISDISRLSLTLVSVKKCLLLSANKEIKCDNITFEESSNGRFWINNKTPDNKGFLPRQDIQKLIKWIKPNF